MGYRYHLKKGLISLVGDKRILFKPTNMNTKYIGLFIVPFPLRRKLFDHFHTGISRGHMGTYKTLFRLRMRVFWSLMRENIKEGVASCAYCIAYNAWRSKQSEFYFSWPITMPFWIKYLDLWSPGNIIDDIGKQDYLMNRMCDLTQFLVSCPTSNFTAVFLVRLFMSRIFLTFGMCSVIVVDDGSTVKRYLLICARH